MYDSIYEHHRYGGWPHHSEQGYQVDFLNYGGPPPWCSTLLCCELVGQSFQQDRVNGGRNEPYNPVNI